MQPALDDPDAVVIGEDRVGDTVGPHDRALLVEYDRTDQHAVHRGRVQQALRLDEIDA